MKHDVAWSCVSGLLLSLATPLAFGTEASNVVPEHERAVALVRQLGDRSFDLREEAGRQLLALGRPAKPALLDGLKDPDPEIRTRCAQLLVSVIDLDFKARLSAFIADKDGKREHDLPGWKRYRQLVGPDAVARELFVEMCQASPRLLEEIELEPNAAGDKYANECLALYQRLYGLNVGQRRPLTLGEITVMLFIATDPDIALTDQARSLTVNLLYQSAFSLAVRTGPKVEQLRKLLGAWVNKASGPSATQTLSLAIQYNLKEGLELALRLIRAKEFANGQAIAVVGKMGTRAHLPVLQPLLQNKTVVMNVNFNNKIGTTEVRDVALAMMVHLSGQAIRDYGFEFFRGINNDQVFMATAYLAFSDDRQREAAHKKFQDWQARQPNSGN